MTKSWTGRRGARVAALLGALVLAVAGCGGDDEQSAGGGGGGEAPSGDLTIAYQPGIGYAQLLIMREQKTLEQALPNMNISYKQLASGAAIRDGMLAGEIQVGSGGVGPFLVGYDAGVGWKVLSALNQMDLWLMAKESGGQTLEDLKGAKIAMPAPDSIQAIVLRKAAQQELGDAKALDNAIVALPHPDALQALTSGQLDAHLTSPPFQFQEQDQGARKILGSYDYFGDHTFNSVFVREEYHDDNPEVMEALYKGIQDATTMIEEQPSEAAALVAKASGTEASAKQFEDWMTREGVTYSTEPQGFIAFAEFMTEIGLMKEVPGSWQDLVFDNLKGGAGS
jgi:NitT/TauT family transport system substrate-binding protein